MSGLTIKNVVGNSLVARNKVVGIIGASGKYIYECFDKNGKLKWRSESKNVITNQGLDYLLDEVFLATALVASWYLGLYTATVGAFSGLTGAQIGGANLTEHTNYAGNRKLYIPVRAAEILSNSASPGAFAITVGATIKGAFLASDALGAATYLLSIDAFSAGDRIVAPGDTLNVTYAISMASI